MGRIGKVVAVFSMALLGACATAPGSASRETLRVTRVESTTPVQPTSYGSNTAANYPGVCRGMGVSNAPLVNAQNQIVNYQPYAMVHGVTLARAPVKSCVSSGFGPRRGGASSFHKGVDLYTRDPTPVYAGGDGVVEYAGTMRGYGNVLVIGHPGGVKTRYAHLSSFAPGMRTGARVRQGMMIGLTGRSGNATAVHLHYEILVNGQPVNPMAINPMPVTHASVGS